MMYDTDLQEVIASINESHLDESDLDFKYCLERLTEKCGEKCLNERAAFINDHFENNHIFQSALRKLTTICNRHTRLCDQCPVC